MIEGWQRELTHLPVSPVPTKGPFVDLTAIKHLVRLIQHHQTGAPQWS